MNKQKIEKTIFSVGIILVILGTLIILKIFFPILEEELKYYFSPEKSDWIVTTQAELARGGEEELEFERIIPVDEEFGIIIPKISANAKVIPEVDYKNSDIYQRALTKGVAHAKDTALPDEEGNTFIFAHSGGDLTEANRYNAVFYLLSKLETEDKICIFYKGKKYTYAVTEKRTIAASETFYLEEKSLEKKLTLMTCWPPGTTLKRMMVVAKPVE